MVLMVYRFVCLAGVLVEFLPTNAKEARPPSPRAALSFYFLNLVIKIDLH